LEAFTVIPQNGYPAGSEDAKCTGKTELMYTQF